MKGTSLGVAEEPPLEGQPSLASRPVASPHEILEIQGDGPKDSGQDDAVEAKPQQVAGLDRRVEEDVAAKCDEDLTRQLA